jgi:hypothetical protein
MTTGARINHALVHAHRSTLILPANRSATKRTFRNVDPSRQVWLGLGKPAEAGKGVGLSPLTLGKPFVTGFKGDVFGISDGPTLMYDSTDAACLLGTPGLPGTDLLVPGQPGVASAPSMVFGYLDGANQWSKSDWASVAANTIRKWGNTTVPPGGFSADADFIDMELNTGLSADEAVTWTVRMRESGRTPIVYVEPMGSPPWPEVISAFKKQGVEQPYYFIPYWDNLPGFTGQVESLAPYGLEEQSSWPSAGAIAKQWQSTLRSVYGQTKVASVGNHNVLKLSYQTQASIGSLLRAKILLSGPSDPHVSLGGGAWNLVAKIQVRGGSWLYVFDVLGAAGSEKEMVFTWTGSRTATAGCEEFAGWIGTPARDPNFGGLARIGRSLAFGANRREALVTAQQLCTSEIAWDGAPGPGSPLPTPSAFWGQHRTPTVPPETPAQGQATIVSPSSTFNWANYIPKFGQPNDLTIEGGSNGWSWGWSVPRDYAVVETNYFDSAASHLQLGWDISSVFVSDIAIQEETG